MAVEFDPMRSLIYVDCVNEKYRLKMEEWLRCVHVPESISQFEPYVMKYAFYHALPVPPSGARFGVMNYQLTEHYWLFNPLSPEFQIKTFGETVNVDILKGQGMLPDMDEITDETMMKMMENADDIRDNKTDMPVANPFIYVYLPVCWQEEYKGSMRTITQGPNYRWQFLINFPENCSEEEADRWLKEEVFPYFQKAPEVRRILSSKIRKDVNGTPYDRAVEIWFGNEEEWERVAAEGTKSFKKPAWATEDVFPFLKPKFEFASIMLGDYATHNNLADYRGALTMR